MAACPLVAPMISLVAFLVGASAGVLLAKRLGDHHTTFVTGAVGPRSAPDGGRGGG